MVSLLPILDSKRSAYTYFPHIPNESLRFNTRQVIKESKPHDPVYYEKLWQLLQRLILEEENRIKTEASALEFEQEVKAIYTKATTREEERKKLGFERDIEFAVYGIIQEYKDDKDNSIKITNQLGEKLLPETEVVEWYNKPSTKRKLQEITYDILDSHEISEDDIEELSEKILSILNRENV